LSPEKNNMYNRMKNRKHTKLVKDYDKQKERHLENLASKMLNNDEKLQKLKGKTIDPKFLNLF
tara:strand:- start:62 stop:250 length:189 start_codon:yes stop_codon:yes gene_type:complete